MLSLRVWEQDKNTTTATHFNTMIEVLANSMTRQIRKHWKKRNHYIQHGHINRNAKESTDSVLKLVDKVYQAT